jgi:hypothetical protein
MTEETNQAVAPEAAPQQEGAELTITDLNNMKSIIDVASQRGAFKPNEMVLIGQTYNKLTAFLDTVAKTAKPGV